jgi:hypothetical protein
MSVRVSRYECPLYGFVLIHVLSVALYPLYVLRCVQVPLWNYVLYICPYMCSYTCSLYVSFMCTAVLTGKTLEFTKVQFDKLDVKGLASSSFIQGGSSYYQPAVCVHMYVHVYLHITYIDVYLHITYIDVYIHIHIYIKRPQGR